jgi:hypothetical protein
MLKGFYSYNSIYFRDNIIFMIFFRSDVVSILSSTPHVLIKMRKSLEKNYVAQNLRYANFVKVR